MRVDAPDTSLVKVGSPLPGEAASALQNGIGGTEQTGYSLSGGAADPAFKEAIQATADFSYSVGFFLGVLFAIGFRAFLWSGIEALSWRIFRFLVPFRYRVRSERRFRRWLLSRPSVQAFIAKRRAMGVRRRWRFVPVTPAGRVIKGGDA